MIRKIKFSNFYSFKGEHVLDFTTNKKKSDNYFNTFDGKQITKVAIVLGPNNSGKTNLMKLLGFIDFFITNSAKESGDSRIGFKPYAFCLEKPSFFEIEFETEKKLYTYYLEATANEVLKEGLSARELVKNSRNYKLFTREKQVIEFNKKFITGITKKSLTHVKKNISTIAFIQSAYEIEAINEVSEYFRGFRTNINEQGDVIPLTTGISLAAMLYDDYPELKEKMEELVNDFDLGITKFNIKKLINENKLMVEAVHKVGKTEYTLPLGYESKGTQALFAGMYDILASIAEGTVLVLDEIETGLHPQAVSKLVRYIVDNFSEEKRQFIFSSHSLDVIKRLDPQQMILVEKNENESNFFRLDEVSVRTDANFFSKYMSGEYGAFPNIRI